MGNSTNTFKENSKISFDSKAENYDETHDGKFVAPMYNEIVSRIKNAKPKKILDC